MDLPDYSAGRSPRRELQGPRPAPLKVRKESHKIKKPPVVPQQQQQQPPHPHQQTQQPRPPVIIYTVSPKVIHTNPGEFMNLVQRLTGYSSTSYTTAPGTPYSPASAFHDDGGAVSPAARFASIERTRSPEGGKRNKLGSAAVLPEAEMVEEMGGGGVVSDRNGFIPGILSPGPGSLPPIPPNLFSPSINDRQNQNQMNPLSFLHDLSPNLHSNRNFSMSPMMIGESSIFMPSPSNLLSSHIVSPTHHQFDLFSSLFDF